MISFLSSTSPFCFFFVKFHPWHCRRLSVANSSLWNGYDDVKNREKRIKGKIPTKMVNPNQKNNRISFPNWNWIHLMECVWHCYGFDISFSRSKWKLFKAFPFWSIDESKNLLRCFLISSFIARWGIFRFAFFCCLSSICYTRRCLRPMKWNLNRLRDFPFVFRSLFINIIRTFV